MKSAGNGGVVQSCLQMLHVHVFLAAQLGARRVAKSGADQHQGGVPVRECPHHTGAAADLTVQPLDHVVGTDAGPMLAGKIAVGQRFLCTIFSDIVCCLLSEWCMMVTLGMRNNVLPIGFAIKKEDRYNESWSYNIIPERLIAYNHGKINEVQVQNIEKNLNTIISQFEEMKRDLVFLLKENEELEG